ncbi:sporulation and cell division protein SsgA [Actinobacteria bacterium OK074]|nr:sporulation and cell division protein SsgA [Actinobacteria bacterium OK074]
MIPSIQSLHRTLVMQLKAGASGRCPVLAHLGYEAADPFAVTASFSHEGRVLARWRFDRQMLAEGMVRPVGEGDVRLAPQSVGVTGVWQELRVELFGDPRPDGGRQHAVILAWAPAIERFLQETYAMVPLGRESVDVDEFLSELTGGC